MLDNERLYERIDEDDEMSDQEKRDAYFSEIDNDQDEQDWERQ